MPFPPGPRWPTIAAILVSGKSIQHKLTAAEGLTSDMIWKLVAGRSGAGGRCRAGAARKARCCRKPISSPAATPAPSCWPRWRKAQEKFLAEHWAGRAGGLPFQIAARGGDPGLHRGKGNRAAGRAPPYRRGLRQPAEGGHEAAIRSHHHLWHHQGLSAGPRHPRRARSTAATPYNTYVIAGLPPGPICNPGKDSLAAVLNPEDSAAIFISSPPARAAMSSPPPWPSRRRNVAAYRAFERQQQAAEAGRSKQWPDAQDATVLRRQRDAEAAGAPDKPRAATTGDSLGSRLASFAP